MSRHFHGSQFNGPFMPKRLRNWGFGLNPFPGDFAGCPRRCPTTFIADDRGHLLPHICRNICTSPWGDYRTSIWEETYPCCCVDQLRNPKDYQKPRPMILVTTEVPCTQNYSNQASQQINQYLNTGAAGCQPCVYATPGSNSACI